MIEEVTVGHANPAPGRPSTPAARTVSKLEFRAFAGLVMATAAISIDMLLPAFDDVRAEFGLPSGSAETAALVTAFFLGMGIGQIPVGMLSDRFGRRRVMLGGSVLFFLGAIGAMVPQSLGPIIVLRFVWGFGSAAMRICITAMIRDRYSGVDMARETAFAMTIFMIVPIVAPAIGSLVVTVFPWRAIFLVCALFGVVLGVWLWWRIPETLSSEGSRPLRLGLIGDAVKAIAANRAALAYTLAMLPTMGVFASYLASSERVVDDVFHRKAWFPYVFASTSILMGVAALNGGRLVGRLGMQRLLRLALLAYTGAALAAAVISLAAGGVPNFWLFFAVFSIVLATHNVLFPNLNAAAMQPVGHVAGTAAAVIATVSTAIGAVIGLIIDRAYDKTTNPLSVSFFLSGIVAIALLQWAHPRRNTVPDSPE